MTRDRDDQEPLPPSFMSRRAFTSGSALSAGFALAAQPVAASTIITPAKGLRHGPVHIPVKDGAIPAYFATPAKPKARPAIILIVSEIFGLHEHIRDVVRRFARQGYFAIAPDLFARLGDASTIADIPALLKTIVNPTPDVQVMRDVRATLAHAAVLGGDGARAGITGFCWGGRITWLAAADLPGIRAGVAWYGRLRGEHTALQPSWPIDVVKDLKVPVLGLYAGRDAHIPLTDVGAMQSALAGSRAESRIIVYDDVDHGFHADYRPTYARAAAADAWMECLRWFRTHL